MEITFSTFLNHVNNINSLKQRLARIALANGLLIFLIARLWPSISHALGQKTVPNYSKTSHSNRRQVLVSRSISLTLGERQTWNQRIVGAFDLIREERTARFFSYMAVRKAS